MQLALTQAALIRQIQRVAADVALILPLAEGEVLEGLPGDDPAVAAIERLRKLAETRMPA